MESVYYQRHNLLGNYNYNIFVYEPCNYAYHFHKNFELVYVIEGELEAQVDGRKTVMRSGDFLLVLPNSVHSYRTYNKSKVWIGVFSEDFIADFAKMIRGKIRGEMVFNCSDTELAYLKEGFLSDSDKLDLLTIKAGLYVIGTRYLKTDEWLERTEFDGELAHKIILYIEENFKNDLTMAEIAKVFGYEYHYFSRCFREMFSVGFKDLLNQYRFDYAKMLITKTDMDLSTVAMESGFGSLRNFNRIYKKFSNSTPRMLRNEAHPTKCVVD